jgi:hypothetical protein
MIYGIPKEISIREIASLQLKIIFRKGCKIYAAHMEEEDKVKVPSSEDHLVLKEFEYVFREITSFPPKRDIYFSINLIPGVAPLSKTPYRMSTTELKELKM